ncbi:MAG: hypothetical protein ABI451_12650 [Dokdonella sp.]
MTRFHIAILAVLALSLGSCVETRFESQLGDNIQTCDARWKGLWIGSDADADDDGAIFVDAECRTFMLDQTEKLGPLKQIPLPINFVHDGRDDYLVIADNNLKGLVDLPAPYSIDPKPEKSFFFARYRFRGDRLELSEVNSNRVAALVIDEKLDGTVAKSANELHVYVRGDRQRMLEIVRRQHIFVDKPSTVLVRSKLDVADYESALIKAQRGKSK